MSLVPAAIAGTASSQLWKRVAHPDASIAVADRPAIGTTARVATSAPATLAALCGVVDSVLHRLDKVASRFRPDSDVMRLARLGGGTYIVGPELREVVEVALDAARWTGGLVDPTVGNALANAGYDRDFALVPPSSEGRPPHPSPAPGWRQVRLAGALLELPNGVMLDLGATAKAYGSDRCAMLGAKRTGAGVLVSLGGDIALDGRAPADGWLLVVEEAPATVPPAPPQQVRLLSGALATSSTTRRRWNRGGAELHHLIDPRTGAPATSPWRTASVAAATCLEANAAATATIVAGPGGVDWLTSTGLAGRLVAHDGSVSTVGGWPRGDGAFLPLPPHGALTRHLELPEA